MSMLALGSSLRGQALLIERVKDMLYGDSVGLRVEVDYQFERNSLIVGVGVAGLGIMSPLPREKRGPCLRPGRPILLWCVCQLQLSSHTIGPTSVGVQKGP